MDICETLIYGAECFLIPCNYSNQTNYFLNPLERRILKMYTFTQLTLFTSKLEPPPPPPSSSYSPRTGGSTVQSVPRKIKSQSHESDEVEFFVVRFQNRFKK